MAPADACGPAARIEPCDSVLAAHDDALEDRERVVLNQLHSGPVPDLRKLLDSVEGRKALVLDWGRDEHVGKQGCVLLVLEAS